MKTVALRFADNFAPECGTIQAHMDVINKHGYVWYGKLGTPISDKVAKIILDNNTPKILLIHSGKPDRYWALVAAIQREIPNKESIPYYYRDDASKFKTWFKLIKIDQAADHIMKKCVVSSSRRPLGEVSKSSMSPYFIINVEGDE